MVQIGEFTIDEGKLDAKQLHLLRVRAVFYTRARIEDLLLPLITPQDPLSLRVLDWLVTNYAKKLNVVYEHEPRPGDRLLLNVYSEYKCWLRNYRRKDFDPFRRRCRITFQDRQGVTHETTVGQLNFIYWAHTYGVLEYTRANLATIEADMNSSLGDVKRQKAEDLRLGKKRKRRELSRPPPQRCIVYKAALTAGFDSDSEEGESA